MDSTMLPHAKSTISCCTSSVITKQRASVYSKLLHRPTAVSYYHICAVRLKLHLVDLLSTYYNIASLVSDTQTDRHTTTAYTALT